MAERTRADSPTKVCTKDGCTKPLRARGLCANHYQQKYMKRAEPEPTACTICGTSIFRYMSPGRSPICSTRCRSILRFGKPPEQGKELVGPVSRNSVANADEYVEARVRFSAGSCLWCGTHFVHDMRVTGVTSKTCSARCAKARSKHAERLTRSQFAISKRARAAIYERDRWTCQLCGGPVDRTLDPSDPWAATLDHIECQSWALIPDHSERNLRLAHRMCNSVRGAA